MSGAEGWSRRAVLGAALAAGLVGHKALAETRRVDYLIASATTALGRYNGTQVIDTNFESPIAFLGIRYAKAERFRAPVAVTLADQVDEQAGKWFGPVCPQPGNRDADVSEDCQFLNIWVPGKDWGRRKKPAPVMVYFHGGAYSTGSATDPLNDGAELARRGDVVVVTVNHRLNLFGYLYLARLDPRFPDSGNAGQLDLILALQWVQRNIAAFGGDPKNVTLFGQSGGGAKIATLMAMPAAKGLFDKAITMSGQQVTVSGPLNATKRAEAFIAKKNELRLDELVVAPYGDLVTALSATDPILGGNVYMGPVLDMRNLHRHPFWPDAAPQSVGIPMLLGNTVAETRAFFPPDHPKMQELGWSNLAARIAPEMRIDILPIWVVGEFRARYPEDSPEQIFHRIVTAARSWRGQVEEADARARVGRRNTYVYQLDFEQAKHTDDIGFAFGTTPDPTKAQSTMSETMMDSFVRFARTGNPGWDDYDLKSRKTMVFDTQSRVVSDPRRWERELFARAPYIQPGT